MRQDVSTVKSVAGMFSPPRQHTSCPSKVSSASAAIANLLHRARNMPPRSSHLVDYGTSMWDVPPRTAWTLANVCVFGITVQQANLVSVGNVDSRNSHRTARNCAETSGRCNVSGQKNTFIQRHPRHAQSFALYSTKPALRVHLSRLP